MITASRLADTQEYYFSRKLKEVRALAAEGHPIINMGIGSPDLPAPPEVVQAVERAIHDEGAHQYQSYIGLPALREGIAQFYERWYGVTVDPTTEVLPLMGSKEGIMHISLAYLDKGDEVLIPNPGYPTYAAVTGLAEATPRYYELDANNNWLPDLEALAKEDLSKVKLMWINYPHMPTGAIGTKAFFEAVVRFAKAHQILVINDNPYSFVLNEHPISILSVEGAMDTAIELNSLSKTFNMAGWRTGMVLGNATVLSNILKVKSNMDSGMFYGIQQGAIAAMKSDASWFKKMNAIYTERRTLIFQLAEALGCTYNTDTVGMFVWAKLPEDQDAETLIDHLLHDKHLFVTPGTIFGSQGKGYIRFSLCVRKEQIKEAISRI